MKTPTRILFVGNSFTYYHNGLETHFSKLVASGHPKWDMHADRATQGGATLKILQGLSWVHEKIKTGRYDVVVLQEDIPELREHAMEPFFENARLFDREIRDAGGKTVLFMAWPYARLNWVTLEQIVEAHRAMSKELGAPVAPVGMALARSLKEQPAMAMLGKDHEHETIQGTYLAACVFYATLLGENPEGLKYSPADVTSEQAAFLQRIAWETVKEWQN